MSIVAAVKVRAASGNPADVPSAERLATVAEMLADSGFEVLSTGWFEVTFAADEQHLQHFFRIVLSPDAPFSSRVVPENAELARLVDSLDVPSHISSYA